MHRHLHMAAFFLSRLSAVSGRPISLGVAEASSNFFDPETAPRADDSTMLEAIDTIADLLGDGDEITQAALYEAVDTFARKSGTPYCPPVLQALDPDGD